MFLGYQIFPLSPEMKILLMLALVWTLIWKGIALWKSARNGSKAWFIVMLIVNTLGILEIVDYIGMPKIDADKKWAVAVSRKRKGHLRWRLVKLVKSGKFTFTDADDKTIEVNVDDFKIADQEWWSFLVDQYVNRNVEVAEEMRA